MKFNFVSWQGWTGHLFQLASWWEKMLSYRLVKTLYIRQFILSSTTTAIARNRFFCQFLSNCNECEYSSLKSMQINELAEQSVFPLISTWTLSLVSQALCLSKNLVAVIDQNCQQSINFWALRTYSFID